MIASKKTALLMIVINVIFLVYNFTQFFLLHNTVILDFNNPPITLPANSGWMIIPQVLYFLVIGGLLWLLMVFKEKTWIKAGLIAYIIWQIVITINTTWLDTYFLIKTTYFYMLMYSFYLVKIYLFFAFLFVSHKDIRPYYKWFAIFMLIANIISLASGILYDDFGFKWLLINPALPYQLCYITTLILYLRIYNYGTLRHSSVAGMG